jgi:hypothetical protein
MWPFKKKEPERDWTSEEIEKLKAFRDVGETFNYLGRTCVVTGHWDWWPHIGVIPMLKFDYCDDCGKLHAASARVSELPALENQQKPNSK